MSTSRDLTAIIGLRAQLDAAPAGPPLASADEVARSALGLTLGALLAGQGGAFQIVRFAEDGGSVWVADGLKGLSMDDLVRAIAGALQPPAYAMALVQPLRAAGDPTIRGVQCRAMRGDDIAELRADVTGADGPAAGRGVGAWAGRRGRTSDDRSRWIGVPPTVPVTLPMLGVAEA
ncbi:MAG: hypothetical protein RL071_3318 [Pseudomonadota bacterium]|jgi:hypothetical protein